jgi:hypothetical protein
MPRHPRDIVPIDNKEDILLAIWDSIEAIRVALEAGAGGPARTSEEPAVAATPEPSPPAAAPPKAPRKKKTTTRTTKKKTTT